MKQLKRSLAILLIVAMVCALLPTFAIAEETNVFDYDGEGQLFWEWKKLSGVKNYNVELIYTGNGTANIPLDEKNFTSETKWEITDYVKDKGPGTYLAILTVTYNNGSTRTATNFVLVKQMQDAPVPTITIDENDAIVSWTPAASATLGYKVVAKLTDADGNVVAEKEYKVEDPAATSQDITEFVKENNGSDKPLKLTAELSVLGDLTLKTEDGNYVAYLNSEPEEATWTDGEGNPLYVGVLPKGVITSKEVSAAPGQLFVQYELVGGAVNSSYVKQLVLVLNDSSNGTKKTVKHSDFSVDTIDVTTLKGNPGSYKWKVTLNPKYVANAKTVNQISGKNGKVNYTVYPLPKPELAVNDDASVISWPAVVAGPEVTDPTTINDPARYQVFAKADGEDWQNYNDGNMTYDADTGIMSVDIPASVLAEGQTKSFKVKCNNQNQNDEKDILDLRYEGSSSSEIVIHKTSQPKDVEFDTVTHNPANPTKGGDDRVYLKWTDPADEAIDHYVVTILKDGEQVGEKLEVAADQTEVDVTDYIGNKDVNDYTATVVSVGKKWNDEKTRFDADSGVAGSDTVTSGSVAKAIPSTAKFQQVKIDGEMVLALVVEFEDTNENYNEKFDMARLNKFKNGKVEYTDVEGIVVYDETTKKGVVTFNLKGCYDPNNNGSTPPEGKWSGYVRLYSTNNGLNADTYPKVTLNYSPDQLQLTGLNVDLNDGRIYWDAATTMDGTAVAAEDVYYRIELSYDNGSPQWLPIQINGEDKFIDISALEYYIKDSDAADNGMVPGRTYEIKVTAFSTKPLEYKESETQSAKLEKFPAVIARTFADPDNPNQRNAPYKNGNINWKDSSLSGYTYPKDVEYRVDTYDSNAAEQPTFSETVVKNLVNKYHDLFRMQGTAYETYNSTVTVLGQKIGDINYVTSDPSNKAIDYRGVVPAEDIADASVQFEFVDGGNLMLSFTLPTRADYTETYDQYMADAINKKQVTVKIFTDSGTLLGEYPDTDGDGTVDVTIANKISSGDNQIKLIDAGTKAYIAICVESVTKFVDGYSAFAVLEGTTNETLAYLEQGDVSGDAVKVVATTIPQKDSLDLEFAIDTDTGEVIEKPSSAPLLLTRGPSKGVQPDADVEYTITVQAEGSSQKLTDTFTELPYDLYAQFETMTAGTNYTVTITAADKNGKYGSVTQVMKVYKLTDPAITEIKNSDGTLVYTADATADAAGYAYTKYVTFATEEVDPYTGASFNDPIITFDLTVEPQDVTVKLALIGGYDKNNEVWVINAKTSATETKAAGLAPKFSSPVLTIDPATGNKILTMDIDTSNKLYVDSDNTDDTVHYWKYTKVILKGTTTNTEFSKTINFNNNVKGKGGKIVINFGKTLDADTEYTVKIDDAIKNSSYSGKQYTAVAGKNPAYGLGKVSYTVNQLKVEGLAVTDNATGKVAWTHDANATSYEIVVEKDSDSEWRQTKTIEIAAGADPVTEYLLDTTGGYEAGVTYTLTVTAKSTDAGYQDSAPATITIYRPNDPSITAIDNGTGVITYTVDTKYDLGFAFSADNGATVAVDDSGVATATFKLDQDPVEVEVTLTASGKYDETNKVYVLDAYNTATAPKIAGLAPKFSSPVLTINPANGNKILTLDIDMNNKLYVDSNNTDDTVHYWKYTKVILKGTTTNTEISKAINFNNNVKGKGGKIVINFGKTLDADTEYTVKIDDAIKDSSYSGKQYTAVAGKNPAYDLGKVSYTVNQLAVNNLQYDYENGKVIWDNDEHAEKYIVELMYKTAPNSEWTSVKTPDNLTVNEYTFEATAGYYYKVTVTATADDMNYQDGSAEIQLYKRPAATKVAVDKGTGALTVEYAATDAYSANTTLGMNVASTRSVYNSETSAYEDVDAASFDSETGKVTFNADVLKADKPVTVTTSVVLNGGEVDDIYVLASDPATTTNNVGKLFSFELNGNAIKFDGTNYYIELNADRTHPFWSNNNNKNYLWWNKTDHYGKELKVELVYGGTTLSTELVSRNEAQATGVARFNIVAGTPDPTLAYTVKVTTNPKDRFAAVAGGYTEELDTVRYTAPEALTVENITLDADGTVTWTVADTSNVEGYYVEIQIPSTGTDPWVKYQGYTIADPDAVSYKFDGIENGNTYRVYVEAIANDVTLNSNGSAYAEFEIIGSISTLYYAYFKNYNGKTEYAKTLYFPMLNGAKPINGDGYEVIVSDTDGHKVFFKFSTGDLNTRMQYTGIPGTYYVVVKGDVLEGVITNGLLNSDSSTWTVTIIANPTAAAAGEPTRLPSKTVFTAADFTASVPGA